MPFAAGLLVAASIGWVVLPGLLYERRDQPLAFSHKAHGPEGAGLACADCHALGADGRFAGIPALQRCAECHAEPIGDDPAERILVETYVKPGREIPWLGYSRMPDNVHFPHAVHVKRAGLSCERCHGDHGAGATLRPAEFNRLTGYGRDIWGHSALRSGLLPWEGKKMTDCSACHHEHGVKESCLDCHK
jgi:hypothetical protein